jgi:hypothetical protein
LSPFISPCLPETEESPWGGEGRIWRGNRIKMIQNQAAALVAARSTLIA